jgi:ketosteroid isomerase-like protein
MSEENVGRFLEMSERFNRLGAAAGAEGVRDYLQLMDPEVRFEPQQAALQGTYVGHQGVVKWLMDMAEHYEPDSGHVEYTDVRDLGEQILAIGTLSFTGKASGIQTAVPVAIVARFREGRLLHFKDYGDRAVALEAAGLSE